MKILTILFIVTSHAMIGSGPEADKTGLWLEELTTPYYAFKDAGYDVEIVTIDGGEIPIDPRSLTDDTKKEESVRRYLSDAVLQERIKETMSVASIGDAQEYAVVFFPGGHGTMWDYPNDPRLEKIINTTLDDGRIVAAVCHGPAALIGVRDDHGEPLVKGRKIAAFTNSEEEAVGLTDAVPFLLESKLEEFGAHIQKADDFQPLVIVDGNLITGQNPASAGPVAKSVIDLLKKR